MTQVRPPTLSPISVARYEHVASGLKNLAKSRDQQRAAREWAANLLWVSFPSNNEAELARRAAPVLDVSERTVINYLRCASDCPWRVVSLLLIVAGAEVVFRTIEGPQ